MKRRAALALLATAALFACSKSSIPLDELSVEQVAARLANSDGKTFIYDNNPKDRYVKGHVPTARWVDHDAVSAAELPADRSATLIFYCANEL